MTAKFLIVLSLIFLVLSTITEVVDTKKVNIMKEYCGNQEFVGNAANRYAHLHCGKRFLTLSRSKKKHVNLQGNCNKVKSILGDIDNNYGTAANPGNITRVLQDYYEDKCPYQRSDELYAFSFTQVH